MSPTGLEIFVNVRVVAVVNRHSGKTIASWGWTEGRHRAASSERTRAKVPMGSTRLT